MTVLDVKEDTSPGKRTGSKEADEATLGFVGSEQRFFTVQLSPDTNYLNAIQEALDYTGDSRLQDVWQSHPYDPWMYVNSKTATQIAPDVVEVTVNYTRAQDPLAMDPQFSWTSTSNAENIDSDADGKPIINSAGDTFTDPIQEDYYDLVLSYSDNQSSFDPVTARKYQGCVNSDTFLNFPTKTVKCTKYTATRQRIADIYYWQRDMEFVMRYDPNNALATGWIRRLMDKGFNKLGTGGTREVIKDTNGDAMSEPTLLNGEGGVLTDTANPVFLNYNTKAAKSFAALNVNITMA
jgi:hypothetical protein